MVNSSDSPELFQPGTARGLGGPGDTAAGHQKPARVGHVLGFRQSLHVQKEVFVGLHTSRGVGVRAQPGDSPQRPSQVSSHPKELAEKRV